MALGHGEVTGTRERKRDAWTMNPFNGLGSGFVPLHYQTRGINFLPFVPYSSSLSLLSAKSESDFGIEFVAKPGRIFDLTAVRIAHLRVAREEERRLE